MTNELSTQDISIFSKAVVVSVKLKNFNLRRRADKEKIETSADKQRLGLTKKILDSPEIKAIGELFTKIGQFLRWQDNGISLPCVQLRKGDYLIKSEEIERVIQQLDNYQQDLEQLKDKIKPVYDLQKAEAKLALRDQYCDEDYPTINEVLAKISLDYDLYVLAMPEHLSSKPMLFKKLKEKLDEKITKITDQLPVLVRGMMAELFEEIIDKFSPGKNGRRKNIPDDYLKKISESINSIMAKDLFDDQVVQEQLEFLRKTFTNVDSPLLNSDDELRKQIRQQVASAANVFEKMTVGSSFIDFEIDEEVAA